MKNSEKFRIIPNVIAEIAFASIQLSCHLSKDRAKFEIVQSLML